MNVKTKGSDVDSGNVGKCKGSHITKSFCCIIWLKGLHRDILRCKVETIRHTFWEIVEDLCNGQLMHNNKLIVQWVEEPNLN